MKWQNKYILVEHKDFQNLYWRDISKSVYKKTNKLDNQHEINETIKSKMVNYQIKP